MALVVAERWLSEFLFWCYFGVIPYCIEVNDFERRGKRTGKTTRRSISGNVLGVDV
jgi:hypothetical protein